MLTQQGISEILAEYFDGLCMDNDEEREVMSAWIYDMILLEMNGEHIATFVHADPPPSANHIYFVKGGRKVLTTQARAWKTRFVSSLGGVLPEKIPAVNNVERYHLQMWVYLPESEIFNIDYGEPKSRSKYPYKKVDTSNFFKLAEDAVAELLSNSCDRQNFKISAHKVPADARGARLVIHLFRCPTHMHDPLDPGVAIR